MAKMLSLAEIIDAPDIETKEVEVPEWGGSVYIKQFSGVDRDAWDAQRAEEAAAEEKDPARPKKRWDWLILLHSLCDQSGARLLQNDQYGVLLQKNSVVVDRLAIIALEFQGFIKGTEDAVKNSDGAPSADSGSDSPATSEAAPSENSSNG